MKNQIQQNRGGVSFATLLGLLFIGLKLGGAIKWSWVWVLAPFWISFAVVLLLLFILGIAYFISKNSLKYK